MSSTHATDRPPLVTGRYSDFTFDLGVPVQISVGAPKYPLNYSIAAEIDELKPNPLLFQLSPDKFAAAYRDKLDRTGADAIRSRLREVATQHGWPLVLLCFEDVWKGQMCHRRIFADWWHEQTGQQVPEADPSQLVLDVEAGR